MAWTRVPSWSAAAIHILQPLPAGVSWKSWDTLHLEGVMARDTVEVLNHQFSFHKILIESHLDRIKRVSGDLPVDPAQSALGLSEKLGLDHIEVYADGEIYLPSRPSTDAEQCKQVSQPGTPAAQ